MVFSASEIIFGKNLRDVLPIKPRSQIFYNEHVNPSWKFIWKSRENVLKNRLHRQMDNLSYRSKPLLALQVGDQCMIQNQSGNFPNK